MQSIDNYILARKTTVISISSLAWFSIINNQPNHQIIFNETNGNDELPMARCLPSGFGMGVGGTTPAIAIHQSPLHPRHIQATDPELSGRQGPGFLDCPGRGVSVRGQLSSTLGTCASYACRGIYTRTKPPLSRTDECGVVTPWFVLLIPIALAFRGVANTTHRIG